MYKTYQILRLIYFLMESLRYARKQRSWLLRRFIFACDLMHFDDSNGIFKNKRDEVRPLKESNKKCLLYIIDALPRENLLKVGFEIVRTFLTNSEAELLLPFADFLKKLNVFKLLEMRKATNFLELWKIYNCEVCKKVIIYIYICFLQKLFYCYNYIRIFMAFMNGKFI
jgi:hypothetical protein